LQKSDRADVLRLGTFPAGSDIEFHTLTLFEGLVALALDSGEMYEDVVTLLARDETEAFISVEKFDSTLRHAILVSGFRITNQSEGSEQV
jgi:hypothetical protein